MKDINSDNKTAAVSGVIPEIGKFFPDFPAFPVCGSCNFRNFQNDYNSAKLKYLKKML